MKRKQKPSQMNIPTPGLGKKSHDKMGDQTANAMKKRVEIDFIPLDLYVVDDNQSLEIGRPIITVRMDPLSRLLLD